MPSAQIGTSVSGGGVSIQKSSVISTDSASGVELTLPVAWPVSSWVMTDANTAAGNLAANHAQTNGTYDVYWTGGKRLGVGVIVTVNALAFEGGAGTNFPANATATVVACKQVAASLAIDGDAAELVATCLDYTDVAATSVGSLDCLNTAAASVELLDLEAHVPQVWTAAAAKAKFTGAPITSVLASHSNVTTPATLKVIVMQDATP